MSRNAPTPPKAFRTGGSNHEPTSIVDRRRKEWLERLLARMAAEAKAKRDKVGD